MSERIFPCDVWFVRHSHSALTKVYKHHSLIEKKEAIKETEKSITTIGGFYGRKHKQCHHKHVMKSNHECFFYSEREAKDFLKSKLEHKRQELQDAICETYENENLWAK